MGDMCMRCIHKKTGPCPEKLAAGGGIEDRNDVDILMTDSVSPGLGLNRVAADPEMGTMSRISTDPEICRNR